MTDIISVRSLSNVWFYFPDIWYCCWTGGCQRQRGFTSLGPKNYSSLSKCWCSRFLPYVEGWPCIQCNHPSQSVSNLKAILTRTRDYITIDQALIKHSLKTIFKLQARSCRLEEGWEEASTGKDWSSISYYGKRIWSYEASWPWR